MKQRIQKVVKFLAAAIAIGYTYAAFVRLTGLAVPCTLYQITGLKCPSCGVTRMSLSLMRLDFQSAYHSNQMLFVLLPVLLYLFGSYTLGYIRTGTWSMTKGRTVLIYICIGLLILFAVYRNIVGI